ncbi:MAG: hypothetical protein ABEH40_00365 [Haloferacaceae archaeon]
MGLFDALREALGLRAEGDAARDADPEDLFGMSTAHVTMEADLGFAPAGAAALCFAEVDATDFADAVGEVEEILRAGEAETGTGFDRREDDHGYGWVVLTDDDPEDLVTSVHFAADTFVERGYGSRLLAAVFAFERGDASEAPGDRAGSGAPRGDAGGDRAYWIYSFRRGAYYPFVPAGDRERNERLEFKLRSVLEGELDVEDDESYWYPLWPDRPGGHPWE